MKIIPEMTEIKNRSKLVTIRMFPEKRSIFSTSASGSFAIMRMASADAKMYVNPIRLSLVMDPPEIGSQNNKTPRIEKRNANASKLRPI